MLWCYCIPLFPCFPLYPPFSFFVSPFPAFCFGVGIVGNVGLVGVGGVLDQSGFGSGGEWFGGEGGM